MELITLILGFILAGLVGLYFYLSRAHGYLETTGLPLLKPFLCFGSQPYWLHNLHYHEWYNKMFEKFGRTWARYDGVVPTICTYDPEIVREITTKQFENFTDILSHDFNPEQTTLDISK